MGLRMRAAFLAFVLLLGGCARQETAAGPEPSAVEESSAGRQAEDNPYTGTSETSSAWLYAVYEAYRGAETEKRSETRAFTYLSCDLEYTRNDPPESIREYSLHVSLPQCGGEDPFARAFSRHYRERYDAFLEEERACLERWRHSGPGEAGVERLSRGLVMRDDYLWNGFCQVVLDSEYSVWRTRHEPVVEIFDAETGAFIQAEDLFAGEPETWLSELSRRLETRGAVVPAREGEVRRQLEEAERTGLRRYTERVLEQGGTGDFSNLMLTPSGLGVLFGTGSIAANSAGPVVTVLPYEDVSGLLAPDLGARLLPASGTSGESGA